MIALPAQAILVPTDPNQVFYGIEGAVQIGLPIYLALSGLCVKYDVCFYHGSSTPSAEPYPTCQSEPGGFCHPGGRLYCFHFNSNPVNVLFQASPALKSIHQAQAHVQLNTYTSSSSNPASLLLHLAHRDSLLHLHFSFLSTPVMHFHLTISHLHLHLQRHHSSY